MKKIILFIFLLLNLSLFSQTEFSGSAKVSIMGLIPEDDYISPVNPGNQYGITDFSISPAIVFDISNYDDITNFETKFSLVKNLNSFELERIFLDILIYENLTFSVGRKPYLIGYGYGWNPTDNINPLKDPQDPNAELMGIDSVSLDLDLGLYTIRSVVMLNREIFSQGTNYENLALAADINFYLDGLDLIFTGYYNFSDERSSKVNSAGMGFKVDIMGLGFYGEGIMLDGTRNLIPDKKGFADYREDLTFNLLAGIEYIFESNTSVIIEYYYNGEGFNRNERKYYKKFLDSMIPLGFPPLHRANNYSKQYLLFNLSQPFYDFNGTGGLACIYSIDSFNITLSPSYEISFSENTNIKLGYTGIFDLIDRDFTERDLSPIKNLFNVIITYAF